MFGRHFSIGEFLVAPVRQFIFRFLQELDYISLDLLVYLEYRDSIKLSCLEGTLLGLVDLKESTLVQGAATCSFSPWSIQPIFSHYQLSENSYLNVFLIKKESDI